MTFFFFFFEQKTTSSFSFAFNPPLLYSPSTTLYVYELKMIKVKNINNLLIFTLNYNSTTYILRTEIELVI